jgi:predicted RNase H-like HicB family nuclease
LIAKPGYAVFRGAGSSVGFIVTIFQDEDGAFISGCPSVLGCVSQGKTEEEARRNIEQAIEECLEVRAERRMPLTVLTRELRVPV